MSRPVVVFASLLACLGVAACTDSTQERAGTAREPVLGGTLSTAAEDAIVKLSAIHSIQIQNCTGALVAPNLILTARHCVADYVFGKFTCDANGDTVSGPAGDTGATVAPEKVTVQIGVQPTWDAEDAIGAQIFALQTTTLCRNDIALVLLDRKLSNLPILPIRLDRGAVRGEVVTGIGYGAFEASRTAIQGVRHVKGGLAITKLGKSQFNPSGDDIPPRTFQLDGGGFCLGDSGGPAISEAGAAVGVFSKSTADCASVDAASHFEETGPYSEDLIRPAFAAAGYDPVLEPEPVSNGTAGAAGSAPTEPTPTLAGTAGAAGLDGSSAGNTNSLATGAAGNSSAGNASAGLGPSTTVQGGTPTSTASSATKGGGPQGSNSNGGSDGGSTDEELVYDAAPPKGGGCVCQLLQTNANGPKWLLAAFSLFLIRRRSGARSLRSHARRSRDTTTEHNRSATWCASQRHQRR